MLKRIVRVFAATAAVLLLTFGAAAQDTNGTLTASQPASMQMVSGENFLFNYQLGQTSRVVLQAISGTAQPIISIQKDGIVLASQPNPNGQFSVELSAVLSGGEYIVEVTGANNTSGLVILSVVSEAPLPVTPLTPGVTETGTITTAEPVVVYEFGQLPEAAFLFVDTFLPDRGVDVLLVNLTTGTTVGSSSAELPGVRFQLAPNSNQYQLQIGGTATQPNTPFDVCLTFLRVGGCSGTIAPQPTSESSAPTQSAPVATQEVVASSCTVTPTNSGGVNIRQSASTSAIIVGALPSGQSANVLGVSPDNAFFNILFNSINGWVARSVVATSGACDTLDTITPPPVVSPPTATPPPTQTPPPTPSGPCLLRVNSPTKVYTTPIEQIDYLYDEVQSGELIPVGRFADSTWWKTNYANAWIRSSTFGNSVTLLGDCRSLPIISN